MNQISMAPLTPVVKRLMIVTVSIWFVLQVILGQFFKIHAWEIFILHPNQLIENFYLWQLATYMFFHAMSPFHLLFNMLMLWFFGSELEKTWGPKFFTAYYFLSGIGAALIYCLGVASYSAITGVRTPLVIPVMGASGALFGLLLAYGIIFSERETYFMGLFPMKAKYFVMLAGALDFASLLSSGVAGGEVAYLAHLGGIISGFIVLRTHVYLKVQQTKNKLKKKSGSLRLVVDNDKVKDQSNPKYWN